jgi:hypothetical protein
MSATPNINGEKIKGSITGITVFSATTISGGTFYGDGSNLSNVVNSLTTSTGLSANTTTGNITILNTAPDQIVTISGGTGILTGGTYPNFEITNTAPDQVVTISDGGGMSITGSYPSFTISNTGETYVTGVTYSANTLTVSQNNGVTPINTTIGLNIKSNTVTAVSFTGTPLTYVVIFTTPYPSTNYTINITGSDNRVFTYESKTTNGFIINTNANTILTGNVDWQTISIGES